MDRTAGLPDNDHNAPSLMVWVNTEATWKCPLISVRHPRADSHTAMLSKPVPRQ